MPPHLARTWAEKFETLVLGFPAEQDCKSRMGLTALSRQAAPSSYTTIKLLRTHSVSKADACLRSYLCVGALCLLSTPYPQPFLPQGETLGEMEFNVLTFLHV